MFSKTEKREARAQIPARTPPVLKKPTDCGEKSMHTNSASADGCGQLIHYQQKAD